MGHTIAVEAPVIMTIPLAMARFPHTAPGHHEATDGRGSVCAEQHGPCLFPAQPSGFHDSDGTELAPARAGK